MIFKRQNIFFWLSRLSVLLIYLPFFAVQCFYNYSSVSQSISNNFSESYAKPVSKQNVPVIASQKKHAENKTTVSLNKRFEPAAVLNFVTSSIEIPQCFIEPRSFGSPTHSLTASFLIDTGTLRGPPAVA